MIGDLLKFTGSIMFSNAFIREVEDWYEYNNNPTPENYKKAIEISSRSQFMASVGIILFVIGVMLSDSHRKKEMKG